MGERVLLAAMVIGFSVSLLASATVSKASQHDPYGPKTLGSMPCVSTGTCIGEAPKPYPNPEDNSCERPDLYVKVEGECKCRWGVFEVGFLALNAQEIKKGDDICDLIKERGNSALGFLGNQLARGLTVLVIISGVLGMLMGGYIYMTAGGSAARVQVARVWIGAALLGIILALLAFTVLNVIQPNLVSFPTP